ncbi:MAG: NADH-ubiquinone oxidoreductase-F iron-sulfur binding region domain-containing protein [Patescibacteria group bacterium]|jgi:NADH:ubiquinone oxidoreductase subunit F (NADH-binding)
MDKTIEKLTRADLIGRGCGNFPTASKWQMVKEAKGAKKYVVCNVSEGEPGVFKDGWVLQNHPDIAIEGIKHAIKYLGAKKAVVYLRQDYYQKYQSKLRKLIGKNKIELFKEAGGYIGGEETALLESLEGRRVEPRLKPPYPPQVGLYGQPTLVNNLETFYEIGLILRGKYEKKRLICFSGQGVKSQVHELPENWTIEKMLKETGNWPKFSFFVQVGGGAAGTVLNSKQLQQTLKDIHGLGSIVVYHASEGPKKLILNWVRFFKAESCGKCVPCREGTYRLLEILNSKKTDWQLFEDILFALENSSFCGLGMSVPRPILTYWKNVKKRS